MRLARILNNPFFAIFAPALVGLGFAALCAKVFHLYGWALFLGVPLLVGFLAGFCIAFRRKVSYGAAYAVALGSILVVGAFIF